MPTAPLPSASAGAATAASESRAETVARLAKALAHPARVQIVETLLARQSCIGCDIVAEIGLAASTTSEHLRILKAAGLVVGRIEPPRVCYSLDPAAAAPLAGFLAAVAAALPPDPRAEPIKIALTGSAKSCNSKGL